MGSDDGNHPFVCLSLVAGQCVRGTTWHHYTGGAYQWMAGD